jgi:hypothetical protein
MDDSALKYLAAPMFEALATQGITIERLAQDLKLELAANETKIVKIKGGIHAQNPRITIIADGYEESVVGFDVIAWDVRQRARMDAQKLLGLYPSEKHELAFTTPLSVNDIDPEERELLLQASREIQKQIESKTKKERRGKG